MRYSGIVQKGSGMGRKLGFPTANVLLPHEVGAGIYAGQVFFDDKTYPAAMYADAERRLLEAHILDFNGDLYGKSIEVEPLEKVRNDIVFADEAEAQRTIATDVQKVREYFRVR